MVRIGVFAGTTEGRNIVNYLISQGVTVTAFVATEYGETLLNTSNAVIHCGRMEQDEMELIMRENRFSLMIDATHPYAQVVTKHIVSACDNTNTKYLRLLRKSDLSKQESFDSIDEIVNYLNNQEGNILLTTGSKDLKEYCRIRNFKERLYVRVLPMEDSLKICSDCAIMPSHIVAIQGPFSEEFNRSLIRMYHISYLVTKDSGLQGGLQEKISAAKEEGIKALILGRPVKEQGYSYEETIEYLKNTFQLHLKSKFYLIGIGTGARKLLTMEAIEALKQSDCVIGAKRMVEAVSMYAKNSYHEYVPEKILEFVKIHPEYQQYAVVLSGDINVYSGAKKLRTALKDYEVEPICGISSVSYFLSKLHESLENVTLLSLHGREGALIATVRTSQKVVVLLSRENSIRTVCEELCEYGLSKVKVTLGECLSYEEERIIEGTAEDFRHIMTDSLCLAYIYNADYEQTITPGIPEEHWVRGNIPMTKEEVRIICLSKLKLKKDAILYDIGAGTGSVAIEAGRFLSEGKVYAIEKEEEGIALIKANRKKFMVDQVIPVHGIAPEVFDALEAPSHAFLGGTNGKLKAILKALLVKNPKVRIVITAVSLETMAEAVTCLKDFDFCETDVVTLSVSKAKKLGSHHLMYAQNPISVFTCQYPRNTIEKI